MKFNTCIDLLNRHYQNELPFVAYVFPESEKISILLQKNKSLYQIERLNQDGFAMASFDSGQPTVFIPRDESDFFEVSAEFNPVETFPDLKEFEKREKEDHLRLVKHTKDTIKNGAGKKIVISRKKSFRLQQFSLSLLIDRLFGLYPTAFRYLWYHPETGLWCGATPEVLVKVRKKEFTTMALAATQVFTENPVWREKEKEEQYLVTLDIEEKLKPLSRELNFSPTYSHRAGSLLHLRTDISGKLNPEKITPGDLAEALHPTPAICGTPQEFAKEFILSNENYCREFYTGFLGPVEDDGKNADFMVNLRCMKIANNRAEIMVGGGITAESSEEEEWEETQNKMQTMLQVLQPMLKNS